MSVATMLAAVNTAIEELVTRRVKEYEIDGVHFTYQDLDSLRRLRCDLLKQGRGTRNIMRPADYSGVYP